MRGRLNIFQKTMLHWNDLHPYNAVHVVRVPAPLDAGRLSALTQTLPARLGLTRLSLDRASGQFDYEDNAGPVPLRFIEPGSDTQRLLADEIRTQINTGFDINQPFCPLRFFAVPDGDGFHLGLVYFHAAADATPVVALLKCMAEMYVGGADAARSPLPPLELFPASRDALLFRKPSALLHKFLSLPGHVSRLRRTARLRCSDTDDAGNGFEMLTVGPDELRPLARTAKQWDATLNDLLLAVLMRSLDAVVAERRQAGSRTNVSLGCIVNTRRDVGVPDEGVFGLFLGSFVVSHSSPAQQPLRELTAAIVSQTRRIKRHKLYLGAALELGLVQRILSFYSTEQRRKLYQKHYPLWGGITNMNLNPLWPTLTGAWDYLRAVSTGPVTPLVLSITTVGERANIGLSFRTTVYSSAEIAKLRDVFVTEILSLRPTP